MLYFFSTSPAKQWLLYFVSRSFLTYQQFNLYFCVPLVVSIPISVKGFWTENSHWFLQINEQSTRCQVLRELQDYILVLSGKKVVRVKFYRPLIFVYFVIDQLFTNDKANLNWSLSQQRLHCLEQREEYNGKNDRLFFPWSAKSVSICKRIYSTYIIMITEIKKQILFVNGFNTVKQNWQVYS